MILDKFLLKIDGVLDGRKGSGHFGHKGRPGLRGGSLPKGGGKVSKKEGQEIVPPSGSKIVTSKEKVRGYLASSVFKPRLLIGDGRGGLKKPDEKTIDVLCDWGSKHDMKTLQHVKQIQILNDKEFAKALRDSGDKTNPKKVGAFWLRDERTMVLRSKLDKTSESFFHHEMGHAAFNNSSNNQNWIQEYRNPSFDRHTKYSLTNPSEGFAESYMAYINSGRSAKDIKSSNTFSVVEEVLAGVK